MCCFCGWTPPPYVHLASTLHPPDIIRVMNETRPSLFFGLSSTSMYYTEHKPKDKNGGALGTRLSQTSTALCSGSPHDYLSSDNKKVIMAPLILSTLLSCWLGHSFCLFFVEQEMLPSWDSRIRNVCFQVNTIVDKISARHPQWVNTSLESQMAHWWRHYV